CVIVGIVLKTAAGIDDAGNAEAIQLAHEVASRIHLILLRKLRAFRQRRIENHRVRPGDEQTCGIALLVALDLAADRFRSILCVTYGPQSRSVQKRAVIKMQNEDGSLRSRTVDLLESRHA